MKKNILITGGLGYIGSSLAKFLLDNSEYNVFISSRGEIEVPEVLKKCNIIKFDTNKPDQFLIDQLKGIEIIIHLAALNENDCVLYPELAIDVNIKGTFRILNAAIMSGVKRFIYFSTAHVYSSPLHSHLTENKLTFPTHPYAITHRAAEDFILAANIQNKIDGIVVRLSNAFGSPVHKSVNRWTLLVNDLCKQIAESKKIVLRSSGVQVRNFITLNDVSRGVMHLMNLDISQLNEPVFNLGGPSTLSVNEVTEIISNVCEKNYGYKPEVIRPDMTEKVLELFYDSTKIANTGFKWVNNIEAEIEETLIFAHKYFQVK